MSSLPPALLSPEARLQEIASLLAAGIIRLKNRNHSLDLSNFPSVTGSHYQQPKLEDRHE